MIIDNGLATAKVRLFFVLLLFVPLAIWGFVYMEGGMDRNIFMSIVAALGWLAYIALHLIVPYYFYLDARGAKMIVRYYHAHPVIRRFKVFEIPKEKFTDYHIKTSLFGLRRRISFYQSTTQGVVKYPYVSISLISKTEQHRMERALNEIAIQNKKKR